MRLGQSQSSTSLHCPCLKTYSAAKLLLRQPPPRQDPSKSVAAKHHQPAATLPSIYFLLYPIFIRRHTQVCGRSTSQAQPLEGSTRETRPHAGVEHARLLTSTSIAYERLPSVPWARIYTDTLHNQHSLLYFVKMAPRGPRGKTASAGRDNKGATSGAKTKSGIQKRRGQAKVNDDGDVDMDAPARRLTRSAGEGKSGGRGGSKPGARGGTSKTAQSILKHLGSGDSSQLASRVTNPSAAKAARSRLENSTPLVFLRVHGMSESKAAGNRDGGLSDLLAFLERKSTSLATGRRRQVTIRKVSRQALSIRQNAGATGTELSISKGIASG